MSGDFSQVRMVHIDEINVEKENITSLKSGRNASDLVDKFKVESFKRAQSIQEKQRVYEKRIDAMDLDTEDDPLELHYQYIEWMQQECTFQHGDLMKVVEKAVRQFRKDERYKNDPRYLRLWLLVAKNTKEPAEVFKYLSVNRIGIQNATFYEEYAGYMESKDRNDEATKIFEQGIERKAKPFERLVRNFDEFSRRAKNLPFRVEPQAVANAHALRTISETSMGETSQSSGQSAGTFTNKMSKTPSISVYQDIAESTGNPLPQAEDHKHWQDFDVLSLGMKENKVKSERMAGATLKQSGMPLAPATFQVFPDSAAQKITTQEKLATKGPTEPAHALTNRGLNPQGQARPQKEAMACDLSLLYIGDEEFSLEEIRALRMGYSLMDDDEMDISLLMSPPKSSSMSVYEDEREISISGLQGVMSDTQGVMSDTQGVMPHSQQTQVPHLLQQKSQKQGQSTEIIKENKILQEPAKIHTNLLLKTPICVKPTSQDQIRIPMNTLLSKQVPSPTINTKSALQDVFQMFNQSLTEDAEDMTISAQVYKPEITSFTIPNEIEELKPPLSAVSASASVSVSAVGTAVGTQGTEANERGIKSVASAAMRKPLGAKTTCQGVDEWESNPYVFQGSRSKEDFPIESTPHQHKTIESTPLQYRTSSSSAAAQKHALAFNLQRIPQTFDLMTPIAEMSYDEAGIAGLSTIKNFRINDVESEHTSTTIGDRTFLSLGDRTISSIGLIGDEQRFTNNSSINMQEMLTKQPSNDLAPSVELRISRDSHHIADENLAQGNLNVDPSNAGPGSKSPADIALSMFNPVYNSRDSACPRQDTAHAENQNLQNCKSPREVPSLQGPCPDKSVLAINNQNNLAINNEMSNEINHLNNSSNMVKSVQQNTQIFDNPCNPRTKNCLMKLIAQTIASLQCLNGLVDCRDACNEHTALLDRISKTKDSNRKFSLVLPDDPDSPYSVISKLGQGAFAKIFLLRNDRLLAKDCEHPMVYSAFKVHQTPFPWEFYILNQLQQRLQPRASVSTIKPYSCHIYSDSVCMKLEYIDQGTLVDCVNYALKDGYGGTIVSGPVNYNGVDELLAMFWTIELLKTIENLHSVGIIHGDIKPDNILTRVKDKCEVDEYCGVWDTVYQPDGSKGWISRGLCLIDWGSAIDTLLFPKEQLFISSSNTSDKDSLQDSVDCWESRNGLPWKYQVDWYGVAGVIHVLLFGKYLQVKEGTFSSESWLSGYNCEYLNSNPIPHLSQSSQLKRYWQFELWNRLFDVLLNAGAYNAMLQLNPKIAERSSGGNLKSFSGEAADRRPYDCDIQEYSLEFPLVNEIRRLRHEMEDWLHANCYKSGKNLKNLLRKVQVSAMERS